jgi:hypothetical protein
VFRLVDSISMAICTSSITEKLIFTYHHKRRWYWNHPISISFHVHRNTAFDVVEMWNNLHSDCNVDKAALTWVFPSRALTQTLHSNLLKNSLCTHLNYWRQARLNLQFWWVFLTLYIYDIKFPALVSVQLMCKLYRSLSAPYLCSVDRQLSNGCCNAAVILWQNTCENN